MDILKPTDIKQLIETSAKWCVSLYMPTHRTGRQQQQDPIRFRNLIAQAQKKLLEYGLRNPQVEEILGPVYDLSFDREFWQHQSDGLVVFLSPAALQTYRLPFKFTERLVVATRFYIRPLLPLVDSSGKFYVLTLSMNKVQLFLGSREAIDKIELGEFSTGMKATLKMDDPEKYLGHHTGTGSPGRQRMRRAIFHGHGGKSNSKKTNLLLYFQRLDRKLNDLLDEKNIPMILAGVGYLLPVYHQVNTYTRLLNEGLEGSPEELTLKTLHKLAWELVEPIFKSDQESALERFTQLYGQNNELAATGLNAIVKASHSGMVETLFIPAGTSRWGKYDPKRRKVLLDPEATPENDELSDLAAMYTILNSGKVYVIEPQKLSSDEPAAILRYTI